MNILLSWSKPQSHAIASALYEWLPIVIPGISPWISSKDISKGREWFKELQSELQKAKICIICLTQENFRSPWIFYETGAISKNGSDVLICPYLFDITPHVLADGPLSHFQCTVANKEDTLALIKSLDKAFSQGHDFESIKERFETHWPSFLERLGKIKQMDVGLEEDFISTDVDQLAKINLSSEARTMIIEVSKDDHGILIYQSTMGGFSFQTHGENLCPEQSARTVAKWKAALDDLINNNVLESEGSRGAIFRLTALGFQIADKLLGRNN
jgi:hypothetical protein